jgi:hypothetical protein
MLPAPAHALLTAKRVANMLQVLKEQEASGLHVLCGVNSDRYRPVMARACMRSCERCGRACMLSVRALLARSGRPTRHASFEGEGDFRLEREALFPIMADCRAVREVCRLGTYLCVYCTLLSAHAMIVRTG